MDEPMQAVIHDRLLSWAQWVTTGGAAVGYPVKSVLHESWMPPARGSTPTMRAAAGSDKRERDTHSAIGRLSLKLRNVVVVHYVQKLTVDDQASMLNISAGTLHARVRRAREMIHVLLSGEGEQGFQSYS